MRSAAGSRQGEREEVAMCYCWNESSKAAICEREREGGRERGERERQREGEKERRGEDTMFLASNTEVWLFSLCHNLLLFYAPQSIMLSHWL